MGKKFRLGDIVKVIERYPYPREPLDPHYDPLSELGIVIETSNKWGSIGIEIFKGFPGGHDCDGKAQDCHGWRFRPEDLEIVFRPSLQSFSSIITIKE